MLRTSFPVDVTASEATCDIQFGSIRRPTHCNTPADLAKFEVCAHQWVDLSDGEYGIALLNDCKYGHHLRGNILDLNLLRSPGYPDPTAGPPNATPPAALANFEVCAHQGVDLSDGEYGIALLNDCKSGHPLRGNILDLTLLRSPGYPDPTADRGRHRFTYSLYPHAG